ncbi:MAG: aldehyde dehydrogenase family protein [Actinobacteria bacterium]|nr:MAG: aldehyde dehydrogenase family protein [Actinomycetota bacterium]
MIEVRNPRTGENDYAFEPPSPGELETIAAGLRSRQEPWTADLPARVAALQAWKSRIEATRADLVAAIVHDTGRLAESELEVDAILRSIDRWCGLAPDLLADPEPKKASIPIFSVRQSQRAYPLVGVISPWNFPLLLSLIDAIPALVAGCSVIVKPSEIAPRFVEPLRGTLGDLPLAYVQGAGETGSGIVELVDCLCFTGSVATGRAVGGQAAKRFIPAFLELGGKDPAVVLASADLDRAASAVLWGGTANAGQSCLSIERVYVEEPAYQEFLDRLVDKARGVRLATPGPADGELGPIIAAKQVPVIAGHLADAAAKGAKALTGGEVETIDGGSFLRATVLTGVDHGMDVMTQETFGPILPVMPAADAADAIRLANDTTFGLSAAVFAGTAEEAIEAGSRIRAGAISVNDAALTALIHDGEKNSFNFSGLGGSRMGPAALRRFGRRQAFIIADSPAPDPWWYPHLR